MTEKITKLNLPKEVVDSNWKDDIVDIDIDYESFGTNKQEREYISPSEVSKESIEKIKSAKIFKQRGNKVLNIFRNEQITA